MRICDTNCQTAQGSMEVTMHAGNNNDRLEDNLYVIKRDSTISFAELTKYNGDSQDIWRGEDSRDHEAA